MNDRELLRYKQRLDHLYKQVDLLPADEPEVQAHWARYLCVLTSGFLETAIRRIYSKYAQDRSHAHVSRYVAKKLDRFTNPKMGRIIELTGLFNKEWAGELQQNTVGELKDAVDSVVDIRHHIAHGRDTNISYVRMRKYYDSVVRVVNLLEQQCE
jgi:hypothetical protein